MYIILFSYNGNKNDTNWLVFNFMETVEKKDYLVEKIIFQLVTIDTIRAVSSSTTGSNIVDLSSKSIFVLRVQMHTYFTLLYTRTLSLIINLWWVKAPPTVTPRPRPPGEWTLSGTRIHDMNPRYESTIRIHDTIRDTQIEEFETFIWWHAIPTFLICMSLDSHISHL